MKFESLETRQMFCNTVDTCPRMEANVDDDGNITLVASGQTVSRMNFSVRDGLLDATVAEDISIPGDVEIIRGARPGATAIWINNIDQTFQGEVQTGLRLEHDDARHNGTIFYWHDIFNRGTRIDINLADIEFLPRKTAVMEIVGDIDGDEIDDVIIDGIAYAGSEIVEDITESRRINLGSYDDIFEVGDVDNDGKMDFAIGIGAGSVFLPGTDISQLNTDQIQSLLIDRDADLIDSLRPVDDIDDINNDGIADIVVGQRGINLGVAPCEIPLPGTYHRTGDFNGDGHSDVLIDAGDSWAEEDIWQTEESRTIEMVDGASGSTVSVVIPRPDTDLELAGYELKTGRDFDRNGADDLFVIWRASEFDIPVPVMGINPDSIPTERWGRLVSGYPSETDQEWNRFSFFDFDSDGVKDTIVNGCVELGEGEPLTVDVPTLRARIESDGMITLIGDNHESLGFDFVASNGGLTVEGDLPHWFSDVHDTEIVTRTLGSDGGTLIDGAYSTGVKFTGDINDLSIQYDSARAQARLPVEIVTTVQACSDTPDATGDGNVDFDDFLRLSANFGRTDAVFADGDFDCSGTVDFADFLALAQSFSD